jgi:hypothetical protein
MIKLWSPNKGVYPSSKGIMGKFLGDTEEERTRKRKEQNKNRNKNNLIRPIPMLFLFFV